MGLQWGPPSVPRNPSFRQRGTVYTRPLQGLELINLHGGDTTKHCVIQVVRVLLFVISKNVGVLIRDCIFFLPLSRSGKMALYSQRKWDRKTHRLVRRWWVGKNMFLLLFSHECFICAPSIPPFRTLSLTLTNMQTSKLYFVACTWRLPHVEQKSVQNWKAKQRGEGEGSACCW